LGVLISLAGEPSDFVDPITFTLATVSISAAIVGIGLVFKMPSEDEHLKGRRERREQIN